MKRGVQLLSWFIFAALLVGCAQSTPVTSPPVLTDFLPNSDAVPNWSSPESARVFNRDNLYDLVDGQAEAFFAYNFEQVAAQDYENADKAMLQVTLWQLATPADAYGLFTASITGEAIAIGNDGDTDDGRRITFWQNRYFVEVRARQQLPEVELQSFAETISKALPPGGEAPTIVKRLPVDGLVARSALFFHQEISIQDQVWLGGENILGLSSTTEGVLAQYDLDGTAAQLLLVQYADAQAAEEALSALKNAQVDDFATADARDNVLGAIFGQVGASTASQLLSETIR